MSGEGRIFAAIVRAQDEGRQITHIGVTQETLAALRNWPTTPALDSIGQFMCYPVKAWPTDALLTLRKPHAKLCFSGYDEQPLPCA